MTPVSDDRVYPQYTPQEEGQLASNLAALGQSIANGAFHDWRFDEKLLLAMHRALFGGVRSHAGRLREADRLSFGPNVSVDRAKVAPDLNEIFKRGRTSIASVQETEFDQDTPRAAIHIASWIHAELVRVHPFEDGSGRTSRAMMSEALLRMGMEPIPVDGGVKEEYFAVMNHFLETQDMGPLVDFMIRCSDYEDGPGTN